MLLYSLCPQCGNKVYIRRRNCEQCGRHIHGLPDDQLNPEREEQLLGKAQDLYKEKYYAKGKVLVEAVMLDNPKNETARQMLVLYHEWGKRIERIKQRRKIAVLAAAIIVGWLCL